MLRRLDRLAVRAGRMATVSLVLLDPETGALRHASAGHLPPLLVEPDGTARYLGGGVGPPLLAFDADVEPGSAVLTPGARMILYTDGLVERRTESIDVSLQRLAEVASTAGPGARRPGRRDAAAGGRPARRHRGPCGATRTLTRTLAILAAPQRAAVVKLVYTQASGACGLYARGGSSPLSRTLGAHCYSGRRGSLPLSSRGLGRRPLTAETGVRIPVAVLRETRLSGGFRRSRARSPRACIWRPRGPPGEGGGPRGGGSARLPTGACAASPDGSRSIATWPESRRSSTR